MIGARVDSLRAPGHPGGVSPATPPRLDDEPLPTLEGRALCFGLVLHAEQILAPDVDGALTARRATDDVIVAEEILGEPDAASMALATLAASGVVALVARRFAHGVVQAAHVEGSAKLLRLTLDIGEGRPRNVFSGIRSDYEPEELVGKLTVVVANLAPRKMKFGLSEGMVLAASHADEKAQPGIYLLDPHAGAQPGMRVK